MVQSVVTVVGQELGWRSMMCHIREQGGAVWRSMPRSSTAVLCIMPARSADGAVVVELSVNGMDTSEQGLVYRYEQMPTVERVRPAVVQARAARC